MSSSRWVVLVNQRAGSSPVPVARVRDALARHSVSADIESPLSARDLTEAACQVVAAGHKVCVVGGDGTVSLAVDALLKADLAEDATVGVLPAGTGCDLIRTFGIPQDIESAAGHLCGDNTYEIDVGRVDGAWGTRHFVNVANTGLGAAVVKAAASLPRRLGAARYGAAVAMAAPAFRSAEVTISTERRTHRQRALLFVAANGQFFAGGWNVAPRALTG